MKNWEAFDNALKAVREDAKAETDKLFKEFSVKHDARIAELHREMEKCGKIMNDDTIEQKNQRNRELKSEIEDLFASMGR